MEITLSKLIKFMSVQCLIVTCVQALTMQLLLAGVTSGQNLKDTKLTLQAQDKKIVEIFKLIEKKTDYVFVYPDDVKNSKKKISLSANNESLEDILIALRTRAQLKFSVVKYTITAALDRTMEPKTETSIKTNSEALITVSGKIVDEASSPLPGVNIIVKGTAIGTVSDSDGNYAISVPGTESVLVFSFIGYQSQEVVVGSQTTINVVLRPDVTMLEEAVVVIGYGEVKRKDVTGSISSITGEEIRKSNPVTFDQALQGRVPGLVVQQVSGQPGGAVSVQIRGISSFDGGQPMYVIDGVIMGGTATLGAGTNPLAGINPSDIESIDVLKDASATAIYGSQAVNGVIIITTKRGEVGPPRISYEFNTGYQELPKTIPVMNLQEYATFINERNNGIGWGFDTRPEFANPQYLSKGTNWQKELFRKAPKTEHTISLNGGDNRTQYFVSGSYFKQEGIAIGSDFRRISGRLNLDNKTTDWLKVGTSLQLVNIKQKINTSDYGLPNTNVIREALRQTPDVAVKNSDGSWAGSYNPNGWVIPSDNPIAVATMNQSNVTNNQLIGNVYAEITFLQGLTLRNEATGNFSMATRDRFEPTFEMGRRAQVINSSSYEFSQSAYTTVRNYLTFSRLFNDKYNTNIMAGHEAQLNKSEGVNARRTTFPSNNVRVISNGDPATAENGGSKNHSALESYFGRVNFGLNDKYLLTVNARADGSSKFAEDNRWVWTYSGALAWKVYNEGFLQGINIINDLKLRAGYGLVNNQNIRDYAYTATLITVPTGLSGISQLTKNIGNPDAKWETTKYGNIGLDAALLDWRITFSVDFYDRRTDNLLMQIPLPMYTGTATQWSPGALDAPYVNIGSVNNKGFDFRISTTNVKRNNFSWKTDVTVSRNINKVVKLNTDGASLQGWPYSKTEVGRSIGEFYGYRVEGVFATASDFETHARPVDAEGKIYPIGPGSKSIWYGDLMFKDRNGDGFITSDDQEYLGSPLPKAQLGLNNSFSYKNWDLNVFFTANVGNKVYNQLRMEGEYPNTSFGYFKALNNYAKLDLIDPDGSATDVNNVYVVNPDTKIPGIRNDNTNANNRNSDLYVEDGSFVRCRTISLGYTFSDNLLQKAHISALRLYVNVSNAFLITKYKGMDPEIGSWNPLNAGYDNGYYAQPRMFTIGANLQLTK